MTLEEAIAHCEQKACGNSKCSQEHRQLAEWLKELQALRRYDSNTETIEERASEYAHTEWISEFTDIAKESYIKGATEQREIDMIQIRQFLEREIAYNGPMSCVDDLLIEELCKAIEE